MHDTVSAAGVATVSGKVRGFTDGDALTYRIDVYANDSCEEPSEGAMPLLHQTFGLVSATGFTLTANIPTNAHFLTTTATIGDNTSTFSACTGVVPVPPTAQTSTSTVAPGGTVEVTGSDFTPGENVTLILHSDPVLLGIATADANGNVDAVVTIPADTEPGLHHIELTGQTSGLTVSIPITVTSLVSGTLLANTGTPTGPMLVLATLILLSGLVLSGAGRNQPGAHAVRRGAVQQRITDILDRRPHTSRRTME
jgi:hypothetical protein